MKPLVRRHARVLEPHTVRVLPARLGGLQLFRSDVLGSRTVLVVGAEPIDLLAALIGKQWRRRGCVQSPRSARWPSGGVRYLMNRAGLPATTA